MPITEFNYRVACKGCRFARSFGAAELTAQRVAVQHHRKNPDHRTEVWRDECVHVFEMVDTPLPLGDVFGGEPVPPPF